MTYTEIKQPGFERLKEVGVMYEPLTKDDFDKAVQTIIRVTNKFFDKRPAEVEKMLGQVFYEINSDDIDGIILKIQDEDEGVFNKLRAKLVQCFIKEKSSEIVQMVSESAQLPYDVDFDQGRDFLFRKLMGNSDLMKSIFNEFKAQTESETDEVLQKAFKKFSVSMEALIHQKENAQAEKLAGAQKTFEERAKEIIEVMNTRNLSAGQISKLIHQTLNAYSSDKIQDIISFVQTKDANVFNKLRENLVQYFVEEKAREIIQHISDLEGKDQADPAKLFARIKNNTNLMKAVMKSFDKESKAVTEDAGILKDFEEFYTSAEKYIQDVEEAQARNVAEIEAEATRELSKEEKAAEKHAIKTYDKSTRDMSKVERELVKYAQELQQKKMKIEMSKKRGMEVQQKRQIEGLSRTILSHQEEIDKKPKIDYPEDYKKWLAETEQKEQKHKEGRAIVKAYTERRRAAEGKKPSGVEFKSLEKEIKEETKKEPKKGAQSPTQIPKMGRG